MATLELKNLHVALEDGTPIVRGVDLKISSGEVHAVMGPNGSGKSTLAYAIAGHPAYEITEGQILLDGRDITEAGADERAQAGLFLAFQYPHAIPGVTVTNFMRQAINAVRKSRNGGVDDPIPVPEFRKEFLAQMDSLKVSRELASRYLNDGFSGGEKKRVEILQMAMLRPKIAVLDETDSGLLVDAISSHKNEPDWMRKFRHRSLDYFFARPMPTWGGMPTLHEIDFDSIYYYIKPTENQAEAWEDLPPDIKDTWDKLGIPEAEKKYLAGVGAQYESEVVYHKLQEQLTAQGVIFLDTDSALREHEDVFKRYFGTIIPQNDNKFAALNSAVWSGGSFIYVPPGVRIELPLQAYFRINAANMGQFERTLIVVDEDAYVHYVEGCTAPIYSTDSLHSAVVEIVVKKGGRCRYTTIQNWSTNVYNLVTKRAVAEANVSKIGEEQLFYLMSRGLSEAEASAMVVSGFVEPITKELPLEYAVEMNRLIQLQMEGSVG